MRIKHSALILTAGFLLIPTLTWSQGPGGGQRGPRGNGGGFGGNGGGFGGSDRGGFGGNQWAGQAGGDKPVIQFGGPPGGDQGGGMGGGRGMSRMDPDQLFNMVSKGQEVIHVDQLDPFSKSMFDRFASRFGLSGNQITRDQFKAALTKVREAAASGQLGQATMMAAAPGGGPMGFAPQMSFSFGGPGGVDPDRRAEDSFNRHDKNQNGVLEYDEMPETLQNERDKYDTNHDGVIDLNEYKAYLAARRGDGNDPGADRRGPNAPNGAGEDGDVRSRPTIFRAGNMPKDFPYAALDRDQDGQIGLYEWKEAGRPIAEFLAMDLNNDGFLTVDEYYRWKQQQDEALAKANGTQSGQFGAGRGRGMGMNPGMMAMGGPGMGRGGNPWGNGGGMMNFAGGNPWGNGGGGGGWNRMPGEIPMAMPGGDFNMNMRGGPGGGPGRMRGSPGGGPGGDTGGGRGGPGGPGRMRGGPGGDTSGFGPGAFNPQDAMGVPGGGPGGGPRGFNNQGAPGSDRAGPGGPGGGRMRGGPGADNGGGQGPGGRGQGGPGGPGGRRGGGQGPGGGYGRYSSR
jgi:Ca2+-binding EF-hand superfamily protein